MICWCCGESVLESATVPVVGRIELICLRCDAATHRNNAKKAGAALAKYEQRSKQLQLLNESEPAA